MKRLLIAVLALQALEICAGPMPPIQTVFIIVLENQDWSAVNGSTAAPYINSLLPMASFCEQYYTPPGNHPSEPNYLWLEAGTNFGIETDGAPSVNSQNTTNHLTWLLNQAGISWKTYQEGISGSQVPLTADSTNLYDPKHNPFVYFQDVTGTNDPNYAYGVAHERPMTELAGDLASNTVARYNFLVPNLCNDGHDCGLSQADAWLSQTVPLILASSAYTNGGALFITWDEGTSDTDGPIGMIVLSPFARGGGYGSSLHYDHGSTLRTFEEIFNMVPLLGEAATATDLSDLFGITEHVNAPGGGSLTNHFQFTATGLTPGGSYVVEGSTDFLSWVPIATNVAAGYSLTLKDTNDGIYFRRFYRVASAP